MKTQILLTASLLAISLSTIAPVSAETFIGSSTYRGRTTMVTRNDNGTHTVRTTDATGNTSTETHGEIPAGPTGISVDDGNGGFKPYVPPMKSNVIGSSTDGGKTTTLTDNGNGTRTVDVIDANGNKSSEVHGDIPAGPTGISVDDGKGGFKPYTPPPKSKVIASSTYNGKTTVVTDNGNGTHTVTVTDENGNTSSEVH